MSVQGKGMWQRKLRDERYAAYTALRDAGTNPIDAAHEVGITDRTGEKYEHAYRDLRGLPRRTPGGWGP